MNVSTRLSLLLLLLFSAPTFAQTASSVDSRVQKLEEVVRALELRVATLEKQLAERQVISSVPADKVLWRKLKNGMTQSDVEGLLGSPTRIDNFDLFVVWRYGDSMGGDVQFDGRSGTVTSWHEPRR
jgi:outer membrane protein assembly factor BamE (lipoprotein component of BamABCDE complex)